MKENSNTVIMEDPEPTPHVISFIILFSLFIELIKQVLEDVIDMARDIGNYFDFIPKERIIFLCSAFQNENNFEDCQPLS